MKVLKIILIIVAVLLVTLVAVYAYYGGFEKVEIKIERAGGETIVYEEMTGDYAKTGEVTNNKVYYALLNDSVETYKGIGIFYDDPKKVAKENLRYEAGCILENNIDSAKLEILKEKYKIKTLPEKEYLVSEFPFKGMMSVLVGIMKVYPAVDKYLEGKNIKKADAMMEIYDVPNKKLYYRMEMEE